MAVGAKWPCCVGENGCAGEMAVLCGWEWLWERNGHVVGLRMAVWVKWLCCVAGNGCVGEMAVG